METLTCNATCDFVDRKDTIIKAGGPDSEPFLASLNVFELEMRTKYYELQRFQGQAVQLNQNPEKKHGMASTHFAMHTLIHNCSLTLGKFRTKDAREV